MNVREASSQSPSTSIPADRALIPHPAAGRVPARRQVAMTVRSLHLARVARAAGAVVVGLAAKSVVRALLDQRERGLVLAASGGALATGAARGVRVAPPLPPVQVAPPFEVARVIEQLPGAARMMVTEITVIERRQRR
jgi:hypothetical protein